MQYRKPVDIREDKAEITESTLLLVFKGCSGQNKSVVETLTIMGCLFIARHSLGG